MNINEHRNLGQFPIPVNIQCKQFQKSILVLLKTPVSIIFRKWLFFSFCNGIDCCLIEFVFFAFVWILQIDRQIRRKQPRPSWSIQNQYEQTNERNLGTIQRIAIFHRWINGLRWYDWIVRIPWNWWTIGASIYVLQTRSWRRKILSTMSTFKHSHSTTTTIPFNTRLPFE